MEKIIKRFIFALTNSDYDFGGGILNFAVDCFVNAESVETFKLAINKGPYDLSDGRLDCLIESFNKADVTF